MNVDEAMAYAKQLSGGSLNFSHHSNLRTLAIGALYNEVERLRAELAELRQKRCDENSEIELLALRVLDSSEVDGDSDSVPPTVPELVELMADTAVMAREERNLWHSAAQRLKDELAAAKAASVVPVKWKSVERFFKSGADLGNQWGIEFWFDTKEQRDKFGKWMKERGEG